jgi:hypothetical protein
MQGLDPYPRGVSLTVMPAVVSARNIMPISARNLASLKYVMAVGRDAGSIIAPGWMIPADGRMVSGFDWPDLFLATRGRQPTNASDDWIRIWRDADSCGFTTETSVNAFLARLESSSELRASELQPRRRE